MLPAGHLSGSAGFVCCAQASCNCHVHMLCVSPQGPRASYVACAALTTLALSILTSMWEASEGATAGMLRKPLAVNTSRLATAPSSTLPHHAEGWLGVLGLLAVYLASSELVLIVSCSRASTQTGEGLGPPCP